MVQFHGIRVGHFGPALVSTCTSNSTRPPAAAGPPSWPSLQRAIRDGRLPPGARLPSTRALAADLGVARGTVADAYDQLVDRGLAGRPPGLGHGRGVDPAAARDRGRPRRGPPATTRRRRSTSVPAVPTSRPSPAASGWRPCAAVMHELPDGDLRYGDPRGLASVRTVIADYVARTRGVRADADSRRDHERLHASTRRAHRRVRRSRRDEPGPRGSVHPRVPRRRGAAPACGCTRCPSTATAPIRRRCATATGVGAAVLTPAHQYPIGTTLAPVAPHGGDRVGARGRRVRRRRRLRRRVPLRPPTGRLAAGDGPRPHRVRRHGQQEPGARAAAGVDGAAAGTASTPSPPPRIAPTARRRCSTRRRWPSSSARAPSTGTCAGRGCATGSDVTPSSPALATVPQVRTGGIAAGLHAVVELTGGRPESAVVERLARAGVAVHPLGAVLAPPAGAVGPGRGVRHPS